MKLLNKVFHLLLDIIRHIKSQVRGVEKVLRLPHFHFEGKYHKNLLFLTRTSNCKENKNHSCMFFLVLYDLLISGNFRFLLGPVEHFALIQWIGESKNLWLERLPL